MRPLVCTRSNGRVSQVTAVVRAVCDLRQSDSARTVSDKKCNVVFLGNYLLRSLPCFLLLSSVTMVNAGQKPAGRGLISYEELRRMDNIKTGTNRDASLNRG